MGSQQAQELYKQRAATTECVNAQARKRGLLRMPVRGLAKILTCGHLWRSRVTSNFSMAAACLAPSIRLGRR